MDMMNFYETLKNNMIGADPLGLNSIRKNSYIDRLASYTPPNVGYENMMNPLMQLLYDRLKKEDEGPTGNVFTDLINGFKKGYGYVNGKYNSSAVPTMENPIAIQPTMVMPQVQKEPSSLERVMGKSGILPYYNSPSNSSFYDMISRGF